jgi:GNAT superfamily N-acetyltransferase
MTGAAILSALTLEPLDLAGVRTLMGWAAREGWNPGMHDADVFHATDPEGFYGYHLHGELIAGGAVVSYSGLFGFMGLFIVHPDYRNHGIGKQLWFQRRDLLLSRLSPGAAIGMDGVVAMQPFYAKGGFTMQFRSERHCRRGVSFPVNAMVEPFCDNYFQEVMMYDTICFGFPRGRFLKTWLALPGSYSYLVRDNGRIAGFASMRKVLNGYKICPLFADSAEIAGALYRACLSSAPGEEVFLDVPVVNRSAMQLVESYNASYVFECGRMYHGTPPPLPLEKIYGITTFELG